MTMNHSKAKQDSSLYKWVVVIGCMYIQAVIAGSITASTMFLVLFAEYFQKSVGETFAVSSLQFLVRTLTAPFIGGLTRRFGCRPMVIAAGIISTIAVILTSFATSLMWVYITYGVMLGLAFSLMYGPSIVIVGQYFTRRHALANGMVFTGVGIGMMALPPLYQMLIETYGWRSALVVISGIYMNIIVSGMLMKPLNSDDTVGQEADFNRVQDNQSTHNGDTFESTDITDECRVTQGDDMTYNEVRSNIEHNKVGEVKHAAVRSRKSQRCSVLRENLNITLLRHNSWLQVMCVAGVFLGFGYIIGLVHFVPKAVSENIEKLDAAFLMTIMGITSLVGRCLHGWFVDLGYFSPAVVFAVSLSSAGACLMGMPLSNGSYAVLAAVAACFGFSVGVGMPIYAVTLKACVGVEHLSNALGWYILFSGIGYMLGAPVAGWLYDLTSNYNVSFIIASSSMIISGCIVFVKLGCQKWKSKKIYEQETKCQDIPVSGNQCGTEIIHSARA
ncbi:monocarboxylate transporter 12-like [Saccoglossus kowalevskii]